MGDYNPPNVGRQTRESLGALRTSGPKTLAALSAAVRREAVPNALSDLASYGATEPEYFNIGEILQDIAARNAVSRDLSTVRGGGRELAGEAISLDQLANPEFYRNRATATKGFEDLVGGQNPNELSGSEEAGLERFINRQNATTGVGNVGDATTTAGNALLFGDELRKKRSDFAQALSLFPGIQGGSRSGIDTYQIASGRGSALANPSVNAGRQPQQFDPNSFLGGTQQGIFGIQGQNQQIKSQRRTPVDYLESASTYRGPSCCFIFLEVYNGKLPWYVRFCRDHYYKKHPDLAIGYRKMASWLVPIMRRYYSINWLVNILMVSPISRYGQYLVGETKSYKKIDKVIRNIWFKIWRKI